MAQEPPTQDERDKLASIWVRAITQVDAALNSSLDKVETAPSALIDGWIATQSKPAFPLRPVRRPPATGQDFDATETRLQCSLPSQVRELYESTNGLEWVRSTGRPMNFGGHFPPLEKLVLARDLLPPLSKRIHKQWSNNTDREGPAAVEVYGPAVLAHMTEEPLLTLSLDEIDQYLALHHPPDEQCLLIAHRDGLGVPVGTIIEVEGLLGTVYQSLSHWLGAQLSLYGGMRLGPS